MTTILLVEDEPNIGEGLRDALVAEGFETLWVRTIAEAREKEAQLLLLDWMLPDGQGIDLLREMRQRGEQTPVILLTARAELTDKVIGFELGAHDYVTKPFEPRELIARIRAHLRHHKIPESDASPVGQEFDLQYEELQVSTQPRRVVHKGQEVTLTKVEFDLLHLLMEAAGQVFTRDELLDRVWGYESYPTTRTVDTHVLQLRQKIHADYIETVRGIGYRFASRPKGKTP